MHDVSDASRTPGRRPTSLRLVAAVGAAVLALGACASSARRDRADVAASGSLAALDPDDFIGRVVEGASLDDQLAGPAVDGAVDGTTAGGAGGTTSGRGGRPGGAVPSTGGSGPGSTNTGSSGPRAGAHQPTVGSGPGITDTTVKIGFVIPGTEQVEGSFSFSLPPDGNVRAQIDVLTAWINDHGGVFGRAVEPILYFHNIQEASQRKENEICTKFTEDDRVFAIVLNAQIHEATRHCYANHDTLMIEASLFGFDDDFFNQLSPYYWAPAFPAMSKTLRGLVDHLETTDFWAPESPTEPAKLGVMVWDMPSYVRMYETDLLPRLAQHGRSVAVHQRVNPQDAGTIQSGLAAGVSKFKAANVNRVVFVGTAPLSPFFVLTAKGQDFTPRYGMTTFDNPLFYETYEPAEGQIENMVGLGFSMSADVGDPQYPFPHPSNTREQQCKRILDEGGQPRPARKNAQIALYSCEALFALKEASDKISGPMTPATWAGAAETLGAGWNAASGFDWELGPGSHDGGTHYQGIRWDTGCACVVYTTEPRRFPDD